MRQSFFALMMIAAVPTVPVGKAGEKTVEPQGVGDVAKAERQAVETAKRFSSAMKAKDLAAAMKVADAPWWQDERSVIHKRADLEKHLKQQFKALAPFGKLKFEVISSIEWYRLRKILTETEVKQGDDVFMSKDFLVFVGGRAKEETGSLIIRIRGAKGTVVGAKALGGL